jgi:hypothetical protein
MIPTISMMSTMTLPLVVSMMALKIVIFDDHDVFYTRETL